MTWACRGSSTAVQDGTAETLRSLLVPGNGPDLLMVPVGRPPDKLADAAFELDTRPRRGVDPGDRGTTEGHGPGAKTCPLPADALGCKGGVPPPRPLGSARLGRGPGHEQLRHPPRRGGDAARPRPGARARGHLRRYLGQLRP